MSLNPTGKMTNFLVKTHGFHFANTWTGQQILIDVPGVGQIDFGSTSYGLCGGMTLSALDTFYIGGATPVNQTTSPGPGTQMRSYIYQRQQDTFTATGPNMISKLLSWVPRPMKSLPGVTGLHVLTDREVKREIGPHMDQGKPARVCLVRNDLHDLLRGRFRIESFQENHQVLAIGYRLHSPSDKPRHWDVIVYDPNYPEEIHALHYHQDFRVESRIVHKDGTQVPATGPIYDGHNVGASFRGFFMTAYQKRAPPW